MRVKYDAENPWVFIQRDENAVDEHLRMVMVFVGIWSEESYGAFGWIYF